MLIKQTSIPKTMVESWPQAFGAFIFHNNLTIYPVNIRFTSNSVQATRVEFTIARIRK